MQRQLLDAFIGEPGIVDEVRQKYERHRALEQRLQQAQSGSQERQQRIDLLGLYCDELGQLNPAEGEFEQLQAEYRRLANAGNLIETINRVLGRLYEDDEHSIQAALSQCEHELGDLIGTDDSLGPSHDLISAATIQVGEASGELRAYIDKIELDESRLDMINQRIATMQDLSRKHRIAAEELPRLASQLRAELDSLQSDAFDLDAIRQDLDKAREDYSFSAGELSHKRQQTARLLSDQISDVMHQLGMEGGRFMIEVEQQEVFSAQGIDQIRYLVSANPGQPPKTLARVASGGELSRISLAIQVIMSESTRIPTLIFDEVDAGVGGGVAEIVGKKLRLLGRERQVFCVTHLPQVASQAHHHFRVEKTSSADSTRTGVVSLNPDERLEEIARMLGGLKITDQTRAHASEMMAVND